MTLIIAHRGLTDGLAGPRSQAENTVAAIARAAASGADAIELDVRVTRDGQFVLGHDALQARKFGPLRLPALVRWSRRKSLPQLCDLGDAFDAALPAGLALKLDVKDAHALAKIAAWCVARGVELDRVALWCRSPAAIGQLTLQPAFGEVALLSDRRDPVGYPVEAVACGATAISLHPRALSAAAVSAAHVRGLTVYAWIRDPNAHEAAVALGVDGLVTDWVGRAQAAVAG